MMMTLGFRGTALVVGSIGIALLALSGCANGMVDDTVRDVDGEITEGGDLGVFQLTVGDCVNDPAMLSYSEDEFDEVTSFEAVPCTQTHTGEVVMVDDNYFEGEQGIPTDEVLDARAYETCALAVEEYTGEPFVDSYFEAYYLVPTAESWDMGDRGIACFGVALSERTWYPIETTQSIKAGAATAAS